MDVVFWLAVATLGFTYLGYPLCMAAAARWQRVPVQAPTPANPRANAPTPTVDVVLVVHNAALSLPAKVGNLLAMDYPADHLRLNILCDGCSDDTHAVAAGFSSSRIRVHGFAQRRGKSACIGAVLPLLDRDIVLFVDVRQSVDCGAVRALVAAFADASVGVATGELVLQSAQGFGAGIDAYWRYEKAIRRLESASGSLVGATGALYAVRRSAMADVPAGLILDDMWIPLTVAAAGYRIVSVEQAVAYDRACNDPASEAVRKRRTLSGNYQLLHRWPQLAVPGAHPLAGRLWGHKWLRLLAPWMLLLALASSVLLALTGSTFYFALACLQLLGYALAWLGQRSPRIAARWGLARWAAAFVSLHISALMALGDYLRNPRAHLWQTTHYREHLP